jgi:hypothetical protein
MRKLLQVQAKVPDGGEQGPAAAGEQVDGLADVAVRGRDADAEALGEAGVGIAVAQMGQNEECLVAGWKFAPVSVAFTVVSQQHGEKVQGRLGQIDRSGVG